MTPSFSFFELHAPDLSQAKAFYGEMFNWKFKDLPIPGPKYALSGGNGLVGGMMQDARPAWLNYVTVDDCTQAGAKAQKLGGRILQERTEVPGQGSFVVIADPFGVAVALWQEARR